MKFLGFLSDHEDKLSSIRVGTFLGWIFAGGLAFMDAMRIWKVTVANSVSMDNYSLLVQLAYSEYVMAFLIAATTGKLVQRGIEANEKKAMMEVTNYERETG